MSELQDTHLFEVSWEVCNKLGGIHTVLRSKLKAAARIFGDRYILLGPLLARNTEFEDADEPWWRGIRDTLALRGINCRFGRWTVGEQPRVILVDPGQRYNPEQLLYQLWEGFGVDSIAGGWDYLEPVLFSTACGEVIVELAKQFLNKNGNRGLAHFHEWMTGAGLLYVRRYAPHVATVFTTHATILGRSMMEAGRDIYSEIEEIAPLEEAKTYNVTAKFSLEAQSARSADGFTTVSALTAREALRLLGQKPTAVTENGLDIEDIPDLSRDREPALASRTKLLDFAARFYGRPLPENVRFIMISGRYEFKNKGIDVFLEALGSIKAELDPAQSLVAFILIPGPHLEHKPEPGAAGPGTTAAAICTHRLVNENADPILTTCLRLGLNNRADDNLKVLFIPVYLSPGDGVLNMSYEEVLQGFDLGVYPSKYEPWGYTPLESAARGIPTVTTDQAGFGIWVQERFGSRSGRKGVLVLERRGRDRAEIVADLARFLLEFMRWSDAELEVQRTTAREVAAHASWDTFYRKYADAYAAALKHAHERAFTETTVRTVTTGMVLPPTQSGRPHFRSFVVETEMPPRLGRLRELAYNLYWSWSLPAMDLFARIDPHVWETVCHNPVCLLDQVPARRFEELAEDPAYVRLYDQVLTAMDAYVNATELCPALTPDPGISWSRPIAYFSTEFGLHESVPIYSGGLGILSGDHLKAASDLNVPLIAVGLFYRYGYFRQSIDKDGKQVAEYVENDLGSLPMTQLTDENGIPATITVDLPGRSLYASIWKIQVGRVTLYLLNSNLPANTADDREITAQLYVGNERMRIKQEILLGIGGTRLLRRLDLSPSVYHLNEGHSAFAIMENIRDAMREYELNFDEARELVRSRTVFTTHTPVEAGNERFPRELMQHYFAQFLREAAVSPERFFELGRLGAGEQEPFVMTVLALKSSCLANGVSLLHGRVARKMWESVWGGTHRAMVPIDSITNGVHVASFVGPEMAALLDTYLGSDWHDALLEPERWSRVRAIPDNLLWDAKNDMKQRLIGFVRERLAERWRGDADMSREDMLARMRASTLTVGFARRFAPYKRANLLFSDLERLDRIVNNERRPVQFLFAGKAHPDDAHGCSLVQELIRISRDKRFAGRLVFLENYDLMTAKLMVQGVDVWLNTPRQLFEASGTSGQKAAINGGINLSIADGWWWEAGGDEVGWTIGTTAADVDEDTLPNDAQDAESLYSLLEDRVVPLYYQRNTRELPGDWLELVRRSVGALVPRFNTHRMMADYYERLYRPCVARAAKLGEDHLDAVRELAAWKRKLPTRFSSVQITEITATGLAGSSIQVGRVLELVVQADLGEMSTAELQVDLVVGRRDPKQQIREPRRIPLAPDGEPRDGVQAFRGEYTATEKGNYTYGIQVMPAHPKLGSSVELGLAIWA